MKDDLETIMKKIPLFSRAGEEALKCAAKGAVVKKLLPQHVYKTPFDRCSCISYVITGTLSIQGAYTDDRELVMRQVHEGETFGEVIALSQEHYPGWITAIEQTELLEIPRSIVLDMCKDKQVLEGLLEDISRKVIYLSRRIHLLSGGDTETRLKRWLLEQYRLQQHTDPVLSFTVTACAAEIGTTRETLSRLFSKLHKEGTITREHKTLTIHDMQWLEEDHDPRKR